MKKVISSILTVAVASSLLTGCGDAESKTKEKPVKEETSKGEETVHLKWAVKASDERNLKKWQSWQKKNVE